MKLSSAIYKCMVYSLGKVIDRGGIPEYEKGEPIKADGAAKLSFIALGDPQISFISPLRSARVYSACRDLKNMIGNMDALVLLGDLAEYGMWPEYKMLNNLLNPVADKFKKIYAVSGNHDVRLRRYKKQILRFRSFLALFENGVQNPCEHYYFSNELNGYKFILLGADKTCFEASYISDKQLSWLKDELSAVPENEPVFVFNHQPLKNTNGLPDSWLGKGDRRGSVGNESDKLRAVLDSHKNVIYITGHLHFGTSEFTFDDLGNIKAVSVPTVGVLNHGAYGELAQGLIFNVYENSIAVKARLLGKGRYVDEDIVNREFTIDL